MCNVFLKKNVKQVKTVLWCTCKLRVNNAQKSFIFFYLLLHTEVITYNFKL
jgi:hypothetical protein